MAFTRRLSEGRLHMLATCKEPWKVVTSGEMQLAGFTNELHFRRDAEAENFYVLLADMDRKLKDLSEQLQGEVQKLRDELKVAAADTAEESKVAPPRRRRAGEPDGAAIAREGHAGKGKGARVKFMTRHLSKEYLAEAIDSVETFETLTTGGTTIQMLLAPYTTSVYLAEEDSYFTPGQSLLYHYLSPAVEQFLDAWRDPYAWIHFEFHHLWASCCYEGVAHIVLQRLVLCLGLPADSWEGPLSLLLWHWRLLDDVAAFLLSTSTAAVPERGAIIKILTSWGFLQEGTYALYRERHAFTEGDRMDVIIGQMAALSALHPDKRPALRGLYLRRVHALVQRGELRATAGGVHSEADGTGPPVDVSSQANGMFKVPRSLLDSFSRTYDFTFIGYVNRTLATPNLLEILEDSDRRREENPAEPAGQGAAVRQAPPAKLAGLLQQAKSLFGFGRVLPGGQHPINHPAAETPGHRVETPSAGDEGHCSSQEWSGGRSEDASGNSHEPGGGLDAASHGPSAEEDASPPVAEAGSEAFGAADAEQGPPDHPSVSERASAEGQAADEVPLSTVGASPGEVAAEVSSVGAEDGGGNRGPEEAGDGASSTKVAAEVRLVGAGDGGGSRSREDQAPEGPTLQGGNGAAAAAASTAHEPDDVRHVVSCPGCGKELMEGSVDFVSHVTECTAAAGSDRASASHPGSGAPPTPAPAAAPDNGGPWHVPVAGGEDLEHLSPARARRGPAVERDKRRIRVRSQRQVAERERSTGAEGGGHRRGAGAAHPLEGVPEPLADLERWIYVIDTCALVTNHEWSLNLLANIGAHPHNGQSSKKRVTFVVPAIVIRELMHLQDVGGRPAASPDEKATGAAAAAALEWYNVHTRSKAHWLYVASVDEFSTPYNGWAKKNADDEVLGHARYFKETFKNMSVVVLTLDNGLRDKAWRFCLSYSIKPAELQPDGHPTPARKDAWEKERKEYMARRTRQLQ